ncbi:poly(R)-hydroxyalkanoic acid synthase subunit PhaE [Frateuria aurantia]|uniref:Poly(3-hydroxyalkanoate) polymerase subunit PhaE n=1 Tax=Frateuria aurantia (strain ATCC 33424 / DSM 6220 / KCTC 2777 / LMG 1558 / NBRC 3245 / NCIMB 13370) TaxID=767434 RepID=H8L3C3_FRAAD|nr:poly(R)-hydroxyalkanoic acid synthase subunit PhaE [Frateuria aurantia]AFC85559.1 Poly(R)-hydroxyalkanoic acid synthase subunit (PHA_synth_III_E) [Frateuria aurantia DSM 6220]
MSKKPGAGSASASGSEGPWDEFQRKASEAWQDWARQSIPTPPDAAPAADWTERIRAGLDGYYGWLGQLGAATGAGAAGASAAGAEPGSAGSQPWGHWIEAMQRGDFKAMQALLMQTPGLGSGRAEQERQKALIAAWMEYLAASQAYEALLRRSQIKGGEVLRDRLDRLCAENGSFESLRQIYDEWIDSAEAAYMDAALSEEFSRAYGALVNAQVRLRELQREHIEQQARTWGLPVSGDVDALGERVESLRRELRQSQRRLAELEARLDAREAPARDASVKPATKARASAGSKRATSVAKGVASQEQTVIRRNKGARSAPPASSDSKVAKTAAGARRGAAKPEAGVDKPVARAPKARRTTGKVPGSRRGD